ncbi:hypothetical protein GPECTOR_24g242 [Gonium pectorale]|uniref:Uncharacterized protein n=1 Tax=Gonium pectorale TaxID=33097 RepID=A0A150GGI4_GONPE|nr:hypothetical protein GPECTOR_24g242 [Gonium pectorale]|eukprot:KXZ48952.1 hypothetical protein GPECTOR_24g242 [Gonium pectorale]
MYSHRHDTDAGPRAADGDDSVGDCTRLHDVGTIAVGEPLEAVPPADNGAISCEPANPAATGGPPRAVIDEEGTPPGVMELSRAPSLAPAAAPPSPIPSHAHPDASVALPDLNAPTRSPAAASFQVPATAVLHRLDSEASVDVPATASAEVPAATVLQRLAAAAFPPDAANAATRLRHAIVGWLASSPEPYAAPFSALLTTLSLHLRTGPPAGLWLSPARKCPKLKPFLLHPDSRRVFAVGCLPGLRAESAWLDVAALRAAAAAAAASGAVTAAAAATATASVNCVERPRQNGAGVGAAQQSAEARSGADDHEVEELRRLAAVVFPPDSEDSTVRLRHAMAMWLISPPPGAVDPDDPDPDPRVGPRAAPLPSLVSYLRERLPHLCPHGEHRPPLLWAWLVPANARGVFTLSSPKGLNTLVVRLDDEALRRAAAAAAAAVEDRAADGVAGYGAAAATGVTESDSEASGTGIQARLDPGLEPAHRLVPAGRGSPGPIGSPARGLEGTAAVAVTAVAAAAAPAGSVAAAAAAAAARIWPGHDPVSTVRRLVVSQLAAVAAGPLGPASMLWVRGPSALGKMA